MDEVSIRAAVAADLRPLRDVFRRASLANAGDAQAYAAHPEILVWPADSLAAGRTRVAVVADRVVGFASTVPAGDTLELDDLFVDPDWMGRGIGRRLVVDAVDRARDDGVDTMTVVANPHALEFYLRIGFQAFEDDGAVATEFGPAVRMHRSVP